MPGKILHAREHETEFRFAFHLDESKHREDGSPDPKFVREYTWMKPQQQPGEKPADYRLRLKAFGEMAAREAKLLAQHEASRLAPDDGIALADEGKAL